MAFFPFSKQNFNKIQIFGKKTTHDGVIIGTDTMR